MDVVRTSIPGCVELRPAIHVDARGRFAKPFQASTFNALGLEAEWTELFFSVSGRGVIRGLHYQAPPSAHAKLVCCVAGEVFDVVVDLRAGSPAFGRFETFELSGDAMQAVFVPTGCAHGFAARTEGAVVAYAVSSEHDPGRDTGLRWDRVPRLRWPFEAPVVSDRDAALPRFGELDTPFVYEAAHA